MTQRLSTLLATAVGVALGLIGIWLTGRPAAGTAPVLRRAPVLSEADGALKHVLLHWTPSADRDLARPYAEFLRALDHSVRITFVVSRELSDIETNLFTSRLKQIDPSEQLLHRIDRVAVNGPITAWSKDRALVSARDSGSQRARLIIPAEPSQVWKERHNDWRSVAGVVDRFPKEFELDATPFDFDAGDLAVGRGLLIFDTNFLEKNRRRGFSTLEQLAGRVGEYFQMQVVTLGHNPGDTPRHHLSMYMTPLTGNQVLVGNPAAARTLVGDGFRPGESRVETGEPLVADFSPATIARFEKAKADLVSRGFEVTSIVNVPFDDKTYLSYTNGVFEVRAGRRIAYVPTYDIPVLDEAAHATYRKLGWEVVPIHVRGLFPYHGTIGCVVNVLARG
jgi:hypothetical protein